MRIRNHLKAQQTDMETRSRKLTNRPFIIFECAVFAVAILCAAATGFCSQRKIAGFSELNRGRAPDILQKNSLPRQTIVRYMNGTRRPDAVSPRTLPPSWNITGIDKFGPDGLSHILRNNSAAGNAALWHDAYEPTPQERDPFAVCTPGSISARCCHRRGDALPYINGANISAPSLTCAPSPGGAHCRLISASLCIRAPPMPMPHC